MPSNTSRFSWLGALTAFLFTGAFFELLAAGQHSGRFFANLSLKWTLTLLAFIVAAIVITLFVWTRSFKPRAFQKILKGWLNFKSRLGWLTWVLIAVAILGPAYFVFYSPWGALFDGVFIRLLVFGLAVGLVASLLARAERIQFADLLVSLLLMGVVLALAESFVLVSGYPFALHWSEGNRLWDYSILFGRERYNYPAGADIFVWIDRGRQTLWGLPFLLPTLSIWGARLWGALLTTIPYALLGWFAFRMPKTNSATWLFSGLWALIFLNQGPIYTPLILSAILVAFARQRPLWIALPLVMLAGTYAGASRFTWSFAPAIWAVMLTASDAVLVHRKLLREDWLRAVILGLAGLWTKGLPIVLGVISSLASPASLPAGETNPATQGVSSLESLQATATSQPYTWYRLLPNETFPPGILLGLAVAVLPLISLLIYLAKRGMWKTTPWQRLILVGGGLAFLVVGIIASAKVGGGADLHNLDMFLVTLVLIAGVVWEAGFGQTLSRYIKSDRAIAGLLAAIVFVPCLFPLFDGKPLELPTHERTEFVLERIQDKVACAARYGPVLFMDQRQLLTFGFVENIPLVPEYEKKFVMDQALAGNQAYFDELHAYLAEGRFALIVSERGGTTFKELDQESIGDSLVEENNAWTRWVSIPLLSYYQSVGNYKDAAIELFMPIERNFDCP